MLLRRLVSATATTLLFATSLHSQVFKLPTANQALFDRDGGGERFFVGTVGKPWTSGTFGCVRSEGWQLHEGLDIRCLQRDKRGEPTDPVMATADGTVAYVNRKPSLSNYGNYIVLRHEIDGLEICSTYAHLREIRDDLKAGMTVKAGENIGVMGRTANTREGISKDRAHVHFELNLFVNDAFPAWYKKTFPGQRNDHGQWNGQNLLGLDPREVLLEQHRLGAKFNLVNYIRSRKEMCRVTVRDTNFPWLKRYAALVQTGSAPDAIAGYEIALNFNGIPLELIPRTAAQLKGKSKFQLLSVNQAERDANPCRRIVNKRGSRWELANNGIRLLELLTY
ncbi:MAG TPA: M23 family metallopeptidase [Verrucomicrobiae bacterium]|nr:M23 family metallopeptidase [Verrucomicrobiae bacterium]